ncbi:MAG: hypothetical protein GY937_08205 [bacterium]|nr:hypothetical protein [bacterium]
MPNAIKGLAISSLVGDVRELVNVGEVSEEEIGKHLTAEDLALLGEELDPFGWYPIECYERLTNALLHLTENDGVPWLRERGAAAAQRLLAGGLYQQLDSLRDGYDWTPENALARMRLIVTLQGSLMNFSEWDVETDPDNEQRLRIVVTKAGAYPEVLRHVTDGFINGCDDAAGGGHVWESERVAPDRIVIRMDSDL